MVLSNVDGHRHTSCISQPCNKTCEPPTRETNVERPAPERAGPVDSARTDRRMEEASDAGVRDAEKDNAATLSLREEERLKHAERSNQDYAERRALRSMADLNKKITREVDRVLKKLRALAQHGVDELDVPMGNDDVPLDLALRADAAIDAHILSRSLRRERSRVRAEIER